MVLHLRNSKKLKLNPSLFFSENGRALVFPWILNNHLEKLIRHVDWTSFGLTFSYTLNIHLENLIRHVQWLLQLNFSIFLYLLQSRPTVITSNYAGTFFMTYVFYDFPFFFSTHLLWTFWTFWALSHCQNFKFVCCFESFIFRFVLNLIKCALFHSYHLHALTF